MRTRLSNSNSNDLESVLDNEPIQPEDLNPD